MDRIELLFQALVKDGMKLFPKKCHLFRKELVYTEKHTHDYEPEKDCTSPQIQGGCYTKDTPPKTI